MLATPSVVRFEPRGAALDVLTRKDNEVLLSGAAGTGKSVGALMKLHLACLNTPKVRALIVRKTHASLTASTLVTFRQKVAAEAISAGLLRFYGGSAQEPAAFRYANGSTITVGGLDRATRLLSTEYDLCFIDEAIEVTEEDIDTIVTRLRNGRLSYQQLIMATNPGPPTHHLKLRADGGRCTILYSRHEDNPRMYQDGEWTEYGAAYLERLESLTGARYQRMRWGKWVAAEGLVFDGYDPAVHLIDRFPIPDDWTRWVSVDFGFTNPQVTQWFAEDDDGRLYLYRELYATQKTVDQHARDFLDQVTDADGKWTEPRPRAIVCDHDAEGRAVLQRELGMSTVAAKKKVTEGIQAVQARLRPAGDGKPRLYILRDSIVHTDQALVDAKRPTCTADELPGYVWDTSPGKPPKETPVKDNDHGCDAMRYLVAERDLGTRPRIRWM
jgi:phage terminase large subunit